MNALMSILEDDYLSLPDSARAPMLDMHRDHDWCLIYDLAMPFAVLAPALKWTARANTWDRQLGRAGEEFLAPDLRLYVDAKTRVTMARISRDDCIKLRNQFRMAGQRIAGAGIFLGARAVLQTQAEQAQARSDYRAFISAKLIYC